MKPTPQTSSNQRDQRTFPLTDYNFQSTAEAVGTSSAVAEKGKAELRTFCNISRKFFRGEATREYISETIFFASMLGAVAWPMAVMLHQLTRWMI